MAKLTKQYIAEHMRTVHTAESFGRAIVEQILNQASEKTGEDGEDAVTVNMNFEVKAFEPATCVQICGEYNGVKICYHVNL